MGRTHNPKRTLLTLPPLRSQQRSSRQMRAPSKEHVVAADRSLNSTAKTLLFPISPSDSLCADGFGTTLNFSVTLNGTPIDTDQTASASDTDEYDDEFEKYGEDDN